MSGQRAVCPDCGLALTWTTPYMFDGFEAWVAEDVVDDEHSGWSCGVTGEAHLVDRPWLSQRRTA